MNQNHLILFSVCLAAMAHIVLGQDNSIFVKDPEDSKKIRNDRFKEFLWKASKSVPRIGRRDKTENGIVEGDAELYKQNLPIPKLIKRYDNVYRDLPWNDLADKVEYYPEILMSPSLWYEAGLRADDFDKDFRMKRSKMQKFLKNNEIPEYRMQAEVK